MYIIGVSTDIDVKLKTIMRSENGIGFLYY